MNSAVPGETLRTSFLRNNRHVGLSAPSVFRLNGFCRPSLDVSDDCAVKMTSSDGSVLIPASATFPLMCMGEEFKDDFLPLG